MKTHLTSTVLQNKMWKEYIDNRKLSLRFEKIWGENAEMPRNHRLVQLSNSKTVLSKLKWLSQRLYARRIQLFADGKLSYQEWCEKSKKELNMMRREIAKYEPSEFDQDKLLFDTGFTGAMEIRLFKLFKRRQSWLSYMDKNYEEEIEDLERGLFRNVPADLTSFFTATNIAIFGFFPLLERALQEISSTECDVDDFCDSLIGTLPSLITEFRDLIEETLEMSCSNVPVKVWVPRLFEKNPCSSKEFVNLFEAVWLLTEYTGKNMERAAHKFIRREFERVLGYVSTATRRRETSERVEGEETFKEVFCPNATMAEMKEKAIQFATMWRQLEKDGKIRKTIVHINRFY